MRHILRCFYIGILFLCYNVFIGRHKGRRLVKLLCRLGPSYIKLGQTFSTRPDLVGDELAEELTKLQDRLPPFPFKKVKKEIEKSFKQSVDDLFLEFDKEAVAAASIAQVHHARTKQGKEVAVKVLRPRIEARFAHDIAFFKWIARILEWFPSMRRLKFVEVVEMFEETVKYELDLRFEAASASALKENCKDDDHIYIPEVEWEYTARRVLTTEWISGISVYDLHAITEAGHLPKVVARNLLYAFFNQAFRDGFFHADVHPGNLFVREDGKLVPVDFGIMGQIDQETRLYVAEILKGFLERDYEYVAKVHFDAGYVPKHQHKEAFAIACRSIGEPIFGRSINEISIATLLTQLFKITKDFDMETQPQLLLLQKTLVLVEGVAGILDADINMWQAAEVWIHKWAKENMGVQSKVQAGIEELSQFARSCLKASSQIETLSQCVTPQGIILHPETVTSFANIKRKRFRYDLVILTGSAALSIAAITLALGL